MNIPDLKDTTEKIIQVYGPFAFGVVALLVIWFSIISPELNRKQLDFDAYSSLIKAHQEQNLYAAEAITTIRDTALILERVSQRLEKMSERE